MVQVQLLTRFIFVLLFSYRGDQEPTKRPHIDHCPSLCFALFSDF